ncbi:TraE/TraK family type IV conjugative transfer system protein [Sulfurimonas sp.]|uniref:TraE/TraK family type IV conjugative transfer system protein n=1 Tax=Sulfurimonas sp. TaxID=2022749 RepID=UPI0025D08D46|nr:TraE/TraK family type IV conjugative transfer system protein [Sulfurimonas sp.]MBW6487565.1 hypothetical protein [Sulfurimonas sp.]
MSDKIGKKWLDRLDNTIAENSKLSLFLIIQIIIIALLIIGYMKMIDKIQVTIDLPTTIKEEGMIFVGKEQANERFFKMWGREDVENISVFNQKNIKDKMEYLKNRMYPAVYYKYEKLLKEYETQVSNDLISQKFTFARENIRTEVKQDGRKAIVSIEGFYEKYIDEQPIVQAQECAYKLGYNIEGGHIYVESFKTTCK